MRRGEKNSYKKRPKKKEQLELNQDPQINKKSTGIIHVGKSAIVCIDREQFTLSRSKQKEREKRKERNRVGSIDIYVYIYILHLLFRKTRILQKERKREI